MFTIRKLLQIKTTGLLVALLLLSGCAPTQFQMGRHVDPTALEETLVIGTSTMADVLSAMDEPDGVGRYTSPVTFENGPLWTYCYEEATMQEARRIFVFVYFKDEKYAGYMWFSSLNVSAHESTPINSCNNPSILSPVPNTGESHARQSRIRSPGQLLVATD